MSQKIAIIIGTTCLMVSAAAATAGIANAMQPPAPQAAGVQIGGLDLSAVFNWGLAAVGGVSGVVAFLKGILSQANPTIGKILDSGELNQFLNQLPQVLALVSGGNGAMVLDVDEKIGSVHVTGQLKVSRGTLPPAA